MSYLLHLPGGSLWWHNTYYQGKAKNWSEEAWGKVIEMLLPGSEGEKPSEIMKKLLKLRKLSEEERIKIVRRVINFRSEVHRSG